MQIGAADLHSG